MARLQLIFLLGFSALTLNAQENQKEFEICISAREYKLYQLVMEYRANYGLPEIPLSRSLTYVSRVHAKDLDIHNPDQKRCNMHSWSDNGDWTPCCYTPDHSQAECMWFKPRELTNYTGYGYEIAHWSSIGVTPEGALKSWRGSKGHNEVMINKGTWVKDWKAIGVGMYGNYAIIWFGHQEDPEGKPENCVE